MVYPSSCLKRQKKMFKTLEEELTEAVRLLDLQDLKRASKFFREILKNEVPKVPRKNEIP